MDNQTYMDPSCHRVRYKKMLEVRWLKGLMCSLNGLNQSTSMILKHAMFGSVILLVYVKQQCRKARLSKCHNFPVALHYKLNISKMNSNTVVGTLTGGSVGGEVRGCDVTGGAGSLDSWLRGGAICWCWSDELFEWIWLQPMTSVAFCWLTAAVLYLGRQQYCYYYYSQPSVVLKDQE